MLLLIGAVGAHPRWMAMRACISTEHALEAMRGTDRQQPSVARAEDSEPNKQEARAAGNGRSIDTGWRHLA